jgi:precorrin-6B methylase 2
MSQSKISKLVQVFSQWKITRILMSFHWKGYLVQTGWIESYRRLKPVDANNQPIPWVTYSFIHFVGQRLKPDFTVFEFGSGNSTLYYGARVSKVTAIEHETGWHSQISKQVPANVQVELVALDTNGNYAGFASSRDEKYDLIIVDGRDRVNCVKRSVQALSARGVLVLDDSEREEYKEAIEFMSQSGFRKLDFWGIAPGVFMDKSTTIFYRASNCLMI